MEVTKSPSLVNFIEKNLPLSKLGSRRKRIWDLNGHTHCPIIGVCLPLAALRKLIGKVYLSAAYAPDYELHILSVNECANRNRLSESLQHELDRRYAQVIARFKTAKTTADVRKLWQDAVSDGDVAGALWAGLAHPRCTPELEEEICRDMHMLQHQAGASARVDLRKFQELQKEKTALAQELESVRQRSARALSEKSAEQENLHAMLMRARAECIGKDTLIASLQSELNELAAADLVICQTGCISHHAYWRVKDFCKRTGKRCVFVENPSASGLVRSLAEAAASNH